MCFRIKICNICSEISSNAKITIIIMDVVLLQATPKLLCRIVIYNFITRWIQLDDNECNAMNPSWRCDEWNECDFQIEASHTMRYIWTRSLQKTSSFINKELLGEITTIWRQHDQHKLLQRIKQATNWSKWSVYPCLVHIFGYPVHHSLAASCGFRELNTTNCKATCSQVTGSMHKKKRWKSKNLS